MRTFASLLIAALLCVAAAGFYRGWFSYSGPNRAADSNQVNVQLSVDPDKVNADAERVREKATKLSGGGKEQQPLKNAAVASDLRVRRRFSSDFRSPSDSEVRRYGFFNGLIGNPARRCGSQRSDGGSEIEVSNRAFGHVFA